MKWLARLLGRPNPSSQPNAELHAAAGPSPPAHASLGDSWIHPKTQIELVHIPAGEFQMGDDDLFNNPRHTDNLSAFWGNGGGFRVVLQGS